MLNPKKRAALQRNQVTLSRPFCTAVLPPRQYNLQRRYNPQKPLKSAPMILSSHRTVLGSSLYLVHQKQHKTYLLNYSREQAQIRTLSRKKTLIEEPSSVSPVVRPKRSSRLKERRERREDSSDSSLVLQPIPRVSRRERGKGTSVRKQQSRPELVHPQAQTTSSVTSQRKEYICHPSGFQEKEPPRRKAKSFRRSVNNLYTSKDNFVWEFLSDDEDFQ